MATFFQLCTVLFLLSAAVQAKPAKPSIRILSEEPRIEYHTDFISSSDGAALRELASSLGFEAVGEASASQETNGGSEICMLNRTAVLEEVIDEEDAKLSAGGWGAAARFEAAAAKLAQLPLRSAATVIARWDSWMPGLNRSGILHLDARFRPFHQRTVLAYLGGRAGSAPSKSNHDEGYTVFPCLEIDDMDAAEVKRRQRICSRAFRHVQATHERLLKIHAKGMALKPEQQMEYLKEHPELTALPKPNSDGVRPMNWQWTAASDRVAEPADALRADPLFALADAMCHGRAAGLRIRPEVGAAVLFDSAAKSRDGTLLPDWQMWHAGCSPGRGQGRRWTAQLFLEGSDSRRPESQPAASQQCASGDQDEACALKKDANQA